MTDRQQKGNELRSHFLNNTQPYYCWLNSCLAMKTKAVLPGELAERE